MKLTAEQKNERAERRQAALDAELAKFPDATLCAEKKSGFVQIRLEGGDGCWATIRLKGDVLDAEYRFPDVKTVSIRLDDPLALAEFIAALIARYNVMVSEMNTYAAKCRTVKADVIASEDLTSE